MDGKKCCCFVVLLCVGRVGVCSVAADESLRGLEAHVAQLVEHVLGKDEVSGSIPLVGSTEQSEWDVNTKR